MSAADRLQVVGFSGCGHGVIAQTLAIHPRFEVVAVADDDDRPDQQHRRNESMARSLGVPYCRDVAAAVRTAPRPPQVPRRPRQGPLSRFSEATPTKVVTC